MAFASCRWLVILAAVVPLLCTGQTPAPVESGIEGIVSVSPSRPGPLRKDAPSVAPAPNVEFVVKKENGKVAMFRTDAEGHFHVVLAPGHYVVEREDAGAAIGHWRFEADVKSGEVTKVNWTGDSGMR